MPEGMKCNRCRLVCVFVCVRERGEGPETV